MLRRDGVAPPNPSWLNPFSSLLNTGNQLAYDYGKNLNDQIKVIYRLPLQRKTSTFIASGMHWSPKSLIVYKEGNDAKGVPTLILTNKVRSWRYCHGRVKPASTITLGRAWATYGPRAKSGPQRVSLMISPLNLWLFEKFLNLRFSW